MLLTVMNNNKCFLEKLHNIVSIMYGNLNRGHISPNICSSNIYSVFKANCSRITGTFYNEIIIIAPLMQSRSVQN